MANIKELLANMIGKINGKLNAPEQAAQPHQQLVTDADGVAKWEDKPFYETFAYGSESYGTEGFNSVEVGGVYKMEDAFSISLDASKRYIVAQYPGYVCDAKTVQGMKYIGNTTILGFGEDTGEPFIVVENPDTGTAAVVLKEAPTSKLFFVHDAVKTIKPIDTKYLPSEVPAIQSAQVGQTVVVKSVDENDKPTEWEAADMASGGVETVNGISPDDNGNVDATKVTLGLYELKIGEPRYTGYGFAVKAASGGVLSQLSHDGLTINKSAGDTSIMTYVDATRLEIGSSTKYVRVQSNTSGSGNANIRVQNSSSEYVDIEANGYISVATKLLQFGSNAFPTTLRYIKTPEEATDAVNKAYVDAKVSDTALILASSTEGSTKLFKITVDDSGTITATEVT